MEKLDTIFKIVLGYFTLFSPVLLTLYLMNRWTLDKRTISRRITYSLIIILYTVLMAIGFLLQGASTQEGKEKLTQNTQEIYTLSPDIIRHAHVLGPSIWIPSLIALLILVPAIRRRLSSLLPFRTERPLHTVMLSLSLLIPLNFFVTVILEKSPMVSAQEDWVVIFSTWMQSILFTFIGLIGVGYLSRLNLKHTLLRLDLKKISLHQVMAGVLYGIGLVFVSMGIEILATTFLDPKYIETAKSTDQLMQPLFNSIFGIITLGLAAAMGEEIIFRGAMLPRFGAIYSSLLFALVHMHYGISIPLLIVFLIGIALAKIKRNYNTTTCIVVHATYNIIIGSIAAIIS